MVATDDLRWRDLLLSWHEHLDAADERRALRGKQGPHRDIRTLLARRERRSKALLIWRGVGEAVRTRSAASSARGSTPERDAERR
jgi:hypothetical protein